MAEKKQNAQPEKNLDQVEKEKLESVKRADAAVKSMNDFTSPEVLYDELISQRKEISSFYGYFYDREGIRSCIERHIRIRSESQESRISFIRCALRSSLPISNWTRKQLLQVFFMMSVEDTWMTCEELEKEFGAEVALLVDGVTKLGQLSYSCRQGRSSRQRTLRKMFLAMAKDIRVILIKLADRLHNMRTLQYMRPEKQQEKARETMDIYAPIAMRLGISKIKVELDDLSLKYLKPDVYYDLVDKVALRKSERQKFVQ